jgi:hypothetical protein
MIRHEQGNIQVGRSIVRSGERTETRTGGRGPRIAEVWVPGIPLDQAPCPGHRTPDTGGELAEKIAGHVRALDDLGMLVRLD